MARRRAWAGLRGGIAILAAAVVLGWFGWRRHVVAPDLESRLLGSLPADQALHLYVDAERIRGSAVLAPLVERLLAGGPEWALAFGEIEAAAVSTGGEEVTLVAAGRFPEPLLRRYLIARGADCPSRLSERACAAETDEGSGYLSLRLLDFDLLAAVRSADPAAADRLVDPAAATAAELAPRARQALEDGAAAWMSINPPRFLELMREPPQGWVNLSLIARALLHAREAYFSIADGDGEEGGELRLLLEAGCRSAADAEQLRAMLADLSKFAKAAFEMGGTEKNRVWSAALGSLELNVEGTQVRALWRVDAVGAEQALGARR